MKVVFNDYVIYNIYTNEIYLTLHNKSYLEALKIAQFINDNSTEKSTFYQVTQIVGVDYGNS